MAAKYSSFIVLRATVEQLRAMICAPDFVPTLNLNFQTQVATPNGITLHLKSKVSMSSWGETVTITLSQVSPTDVRMDVLSECNMPTQIFDWGKNKKNVGMIFDYMNMNLHRFAAPAPQASYQAPQAKVCPCCASPIEEGELFCSNCGTRQN